MLTGVAYAAYHHDNHHAEKTNKPVAMVTIYGANSREDEREGERERERAGGRPLTHTLLMQSHNNIKKKQKEAKNKQTK